MSIKMRLRIAAWLPALFGSLIGAALWMSWAEVDLVRVRAEQAEAIVRSLSELNVLTQEFLLFGGARVAEQLTRQQAALAATLGTTAFPTAAQQRQLQAIRRGQHDLGQLLTLLLEGRPLNRDQLAGALLVKVQDLRFKARQLAQRENRAVVEIQRRVDRLVLGALAVLILLSVVLLNWLNRRLGRGLERLAAGVHRVEGGDLVHRVPVERNDEIGRLAAAFNAMTGRLRESNALVAERTAALTRRSAELETANADLESFSYSVSHDLRAPLRAIDGFAAILRDDYAPRLDTEGVRLLAVVSDNARRMAQLIDDILALSRAGRQTMQRIDLDMNALVNEVWQGLAPERVGRAVQLHLTELPPACGDPGAIRQVWQNLLGNALKFSRDRDPAVIEVEARAQGGEILYSVADNGVGFDPAYAGKLFGLFQRLHGMDEFEGTGVGLAIVKRYIEKHGGRAMGEGRPGRGATFCFSLSGSHDHE
ncbi:ATP-binding protein [uncultured Thiodictyon sp.]|uniref:sensor histidine kinase n=1 Tax=uncultured Thiodictyon sp. TaxID=1846217 RepID=UPI002600900A|nr:ATP-binding protein [uncultured Thiodictyon sp.]